MDRSAMWHVLDAERAGLADLLASLSEAEWEHPSLCAGWRVREVAAHLALGPRTSLPHALVEVVRARGSFDSMIDATARRAATRPVELLVADLRAVAGSRRLAPGQRLRDAVMDVLVHGQDVAVPLGRSRPMPLDAARASAVHLWRIGFPFQARSRLRGFRLRATDLDWTAGEGAEVAGPIAALLPLLAGRTATLPRLSGEGAARLAARRPAGSANDR